MKNQVLSIEQMSRLKELGVDTSKACMHFLYMPTAKSIMSGVYEVDDEPEVFVSQNGMNHEHPTFALQDVIELLPKQLPQNDFGYNCLLITPNAGLNGYVFHYKDNEDGEIYKQIYSEDILQAAYEMLIWVIENGYL